MHYRYSAPLLASGSTLPRESKVLMSVARIIFRFPIQPPFSEPVVPFLPKIAVVRVLPRCRWRCIDRACVGKPQASSSYPFKLIVGILGGSRCIASYWQPRLQSHFAWRRRRPPQPISALTDARGAATTRRWTGTGSITIRTCIIHRTSGAKSTSRAAIACTIAIHRKCGFRCTTKSGTTNIHRTADFTAVTISS